MLSSMNDNYFDVLITSNEITSTSTSTSTSTNNIPPIYAAPTPDNALIYADPVPINDTLPIYASPTPISGLDVIISDPIVLI
ncbi:MAG: hypothetical protein LZF61_06390 [Nitrosomonas sp.]|nr:MAG: hypothetical protein LZF61_06390 [Nitrosomonas sp.]